MRISDWSSDVCSSDLRDDIVVERARRDRLLGLLRKQRPCGIDTVAARDRGACLAVLAGREGAARDAVDEHLHPPRVVARGEPPELGRGSCRESGWQEG